MPTLQNSHVTTKDGCTRLPGRCLLWDRSILADYFVDPDTFGQWRLRESNSTCPTVSVGFFRADNAQPLLHFIAAKTGFFPLCFYHFVIFVAFCCFCSRCSWRFCSFHGEKEAKNAIWRGRKSHAPARPWVTPKWACSKRFPAVPYGSQPFPTVPFCSVWSRLVPFGTVRDSSGHGQGRYGGGQKTVSTTACGYSTTR